MRRAGPGHATAVNPAHSTILGSKGNIIATLKPARINGECPGRTYMKNESGSAGSVAVFKVAAFLIIFLGLIAIWHGRSIRDVRPTETSDVDAQAAEPAEGGSPPTQRRSAGCPARSGQGPAVSRSILRVDRTSGLGRHCRKSPARGLRRGSRQCGRPSLCQLYDILIRPHGSQRV